MHFIFLKVILSVYFNPLLANGASCKRVRLCFAVDPVSF